jgi:hypothetical protein
LTAITGRRRFCPIWFWRPVDVLPKKEPAERNVAQRDWPPLIFISRNPGFSWAIRRMRPNSVRPRRYFRKSTIARHAMPNDSRPPNHCRNLPGRSVLRRSSDNERCGHPASKLYRKFTIGRVGYGAGNHAGRGVAQAADASTGSGQRLSPRYQLSH